MTDAQLQAALQVITGNDFDYEQAQALLRLAHSQKVTSAALPQLFEAIKGIGSDYEQARVVLALLKDNETDRDSYNLMESGEPERLLAGQVTVVLFAVLRVKPALVLMFTHEEGKSSAAANRGKKKKPATQKLKLWLSCRVWLSITVRAILLLEAL